MGLGTVAFRLKFLSCTLNTSILAINPGKPFVQVAAVDKSAEGLLLYPAMKKLKNTRCILIKLHVLDDKNLINNITFRDIYSDFSAFFIPH